MRGFRPLDEIREEFRFILPGTNYQIHIPGDGDRELRLFFDSILSVPQEQVGELIGRVLEKIEPLDGIRYEWVRKLSEHYPEDIGVLCPFFLNLIVLHRGDAMFLPAGELHAYLHGLGVELMANSDNVLRGGLTSKHVAKQELLEVLTFRAEKPDILKPRTGRSGEAVYSVPIDEFSLAVLDLDNGDEYTSEEGRNVEIYFCEEGEGVLRTANGGRDRGQTQIRFAKGDSWIVPASAGMYSIRGRAKLYRAAVP
jgi:mannose-6-phosphate isomerase